MVQYKIINSYAFLNSDKTVGSDQVILSLLLTFLCFLLLLLALLQRFKMVVLSLFQHIQLFLQYSVFTEANFVGFLCIRMIIHRIVFKKTFYKIFNFKINQNILQLHFAKLRITPLVVRICLYKSQNTLRRSSNP